MDLSKLNPLWTVPAVLALAVIFALASYSGMLEKSPTYDEPLHLVGGMVHRYANDFRINPEDPALFGWWASLPHARESLPIDTKSAFYEGATTGDTDQQWFFIHEALYGRTTADDLTRVSDLFNQSRVMFVILGAALAVLIALWAYQIRGGWAAIAAAAFFCFDPNFIAHAALIKNDVPLSLMMCLMCFFIWRFGRDGGLYWLLLAAIACGLAVNVKFSGVLLGPMAILLVGARMLLPLPWRIHGKPVDSWPARLAVAGIALGAILLAVFIITWGVYGFRYSATASGQPLRSQPLVDKAVRNATIVKLGEATAQTMTKDAVDKLAQESQKNGEIPLAVRLDLWMQSLHLLPEGWLYGFLYTYATTLLRSAYLMGSIASTGRWYYFPLAFLFKTPTATLLAIGLVPLACVPTFFRESPVDIPEEGEVIVPREEKWWTVIVLIVPPALYFLIALSTNLNLGLRHILPVYPFIFIALGAGIGRFLEWFPRVGLTLGVLLLAGLLTETLLSYPDCLAFFNTLSGGSAGGLALLGDSNLDWGQDLPALAKWQRTHPDDKLYLCYFGMADPNLYGINFINLPGGWPFSPPSVLDANQPGVIAMSATNVQGIYLSDQLTDAYRKVLQGEKPFKVLNGTIYLYNWPPKLN
jgi:4-amino-4-deoxy-L-arabinose transferase-like glycosyltransferase